MNRADSDSFKAYIITQQLYVDLNDLENPLKPLYTNELFYDFALLNEIKYMHLEIERQQIELEDNWWDILSQSSIINRNSIRYAGSSSEKSNSNSNKLILTIGLGEKINQFGRKVLNFLEVTGVIGGIFELLDILIGAIISFVYAYMFRKELKKDLAIAQTEIHKLQESIKKIKKKNSG